MAPWVVAHGRRSGARAGSPSPCSPPTNLTTRRCSPSSPWTAPRRGRTDNGARLACRECEEAGMDEKVLKPIDRDELFEHLEDGGASAPD